MEGFDKQRNRSSYTDTTAEDGVTYYYTVRAINGSVVVHPMIRRRALHV